MSAVDLKPSGELLREVRARFVAKGTSLGKWCGENGILRQNAASALLGTWTGPSARKLVERIVSAELGMVSVKRTHDFVKCQHLGEFWFEEARRSLLEGDLREAVASLRRAADLFEHAADDIDAMIARCNEASSAGEGA